MAQPTKRRRLRALRPIRPGAPPGELHVDAAARPTTITAMAYGPAEVREVAVADVRALGELLGRWPVVWIDLVGLGSADVLEQLAATLGLHRLTLADIVNVGQRAKLELYDEYLFIVARMAPRDSDSYEQLGIVIGKNFVLTAQELPGDCFEAIRTRLRQNQGRIRHLGADYLAYTLLDAVIDDYFPLLEKTGEELHALEELALAQPGHETLDRVRKARVGLLELRRTVWPYRELLNALVRDEHELITPPTRLYLRDCYDHAIQLLDLLEVYRELSSDLMHVYMTSLSNRMNQVMKVLTIISTIFMPLGFIAGVYGMNFDTRWPLNMPELRWPYGYLFALGLMGSVACGLLLFFKRKRWF